MNELNVLAAILTIAAMRSQLQQGAIPQQAAHESVTMYQRILAELIQMPPAQPPHP
jgi:hypothetical protein